MAAMIKKMKKKMPRLFLVGITLLCFFLSYWLMFALLQLAGVSPDTVKLCSVTVASLVGVVTFVVELVRFLRSC